MLKGSRDLVTRVITRVTILITRIKVLITLLTESHDPPSGAAGFGFIEPDVYSLVLSEGIVAGCETLGAL